MPKPLPFRSFLTSRAGALAAFGALVAVSLAAELTSYARPDIGFLLDAAGRVLDGAKLYVDVVEINPPLIVALNIPAVLLARALHLSDILVYRLGFTIVLVAGLALASRHARRLLPAEDEWRRLLLVVLAFVLFPLAAQDFGQREHLLLAAVISYLLLSATRAAGQQVPVGDATITGVFVALGFALKPHFLPLWVLVEAYLRLVPSPHRSELARRLAPESIAVAVTLTAYGFAVLLVTPEYLPFVRLVAAEYGRFLHNSFWQLLITGPGAALSLLALLAFAALRRRAGHPVLRDLLALGVFACFLGGAVQQKGLRYHFYPSFALAIVMLSCIATDTRAPLQRRVQRIYYAVASGVAVTAVLIVTMQNIVQAAGLGDRAEARGFQRLVDLVRARGAGGTMYVMSYHIGSTYPLVNYSGIPSASRFPQLWIVAAEYLDDLNAAQPLRYHSPEAMSPSERYLNDAVLADLRAHRPKVLLILRSARDLPMNGYRRINYVAYFGRDPRFAEIFDRYQWVADAGEYALYERIADGAARAGPPPAAVPGTRDIIRQDAEGVHLRFRDPTFILAAVVFALSAVVAYRRGPSAM